MRESCERVWGLGFRERAMERWRDGEMKNKEY